MTLEVKGNDVHDVMQQLGRQSAYRSSWLNIEPYTSDYGWKPTGKFKIHWSKGEESFTKIVDSETDLLCLIRPLISEYTKWFKEEERKKAQLLKDAARLEVRRCQIELKVAKKKLKEAA